MRKLLGLALFCAGSGLAQNNIACAGTPGNTTGTHYQFCVSSTRAVFVCTNSSGCTVAADWAPVTNLASPVFTGSITTPITGVAQCLQASPTGIMTGTSFQCLTGNFSQLTTGTLTGQALTMGMGASLVPSGTGVVNANRINGATVATGCQVTASNSTGQIICGTPGGGNGNGGGGSPPQWTDLTSSTTPAISCTSNTIPSATFNVGQLSADVSPTWANNCPPGVTLNFQVRQATTPAPAFHIHWPVQFTQACDASPTPAAWTKLSGRWDATNHLFQVSGCVPDSGPAIIPTQGPPTGAPATTATIWCWGNSIDGTFTCRNSSGATVSAPAPARAPARKR